MIEKIKNWFKKKSTEDHKATGKNMLQKWKGIIRKLIKVLFEFAFMYCEDDCNKCELKNICYVSILLDKNNKQDIE